MMFFLNKRLHSLPLPVMLCINEWRAKHFHLPFACMVFVMTTLLLTQSLTSLLRITLYNETTQLLAADAILTTPTPLSDTLLHQLQQHPIEMCKTVTTNTLLQANQNHLLISLKAVDTDYPIKSGLTLYPQQSDIDFTQKTVETELVETGPSLGEAWIDSAILERLQLTVGDSIMIGQQSLTITRVIAFEPDRSFRFYSLSPRVMITEADFINTGILYPGSRVTYRYLISGTKETIHQLIPSIQTLLNDHQTIKKSTESNSTIKRFLTRANLFLLLIGGLSAGVALAGLWLVLDRMVRRLTTTIATLRCIGMSRLALIKMVLVLIGSIIVMATLLSILVTMTLLAQIPTISNFYNGPTIVIDSLTLFDHSSLIGALIIIISICWSRLNRILNTSPTITLRNQDESLLSLSKSSSQQTTYHHYITRESPPALLMILGFMLYLTPFSSNLITLIQLLIITISTLTLLYLIATQLTLKLWHYLNELNIEWELALAQWHTRKRLNHFQVTLFALITASGIIMMILKGDLFDRWQQTLPPDTPNYFITNLFIEDIPLFQDTLIEHNINTEPLYPIVRGKLIEQNGVKLEKPITKESEDNEPTVRALERELNLTWSDALPSDNQIVKGRWWSDRDHGKAFVSIEERLSKKLNISIGDILSFSLAGTLYKAEVKSIRSVKWESFKPNFYFIFPPGIFDEGEATFLSSFYLPVDPENIESTPVSRALITQLPHITLFSVDPIIQQIRHIVHYVSFAITGALLFLTTAGTLLLSVMMISSWDERIQTFSLLRTIGASKRSITLISIKESFIMGGSVALMGCFCGEMLAALLAIALFKIDPIIHLRIWAEATLWILSVFLLFGFVTAMISSRRS